MKPLGHAPCPQVALEPAPAYLAGVGAEAAAAALQAGRAAQAACRVRAVLTAPVRLLPVRVPRWLGLVVKAPGEAGVVPVAVIVFLGPGGGSRQRQGSYAAHG